jgi:non-homologous end joining protein Ku
MKLDADIGEEVANEDTGKTYTLDKNNFIEVTKELEGDALESARNIEIEPRF